MTYVLEATRATQGSRDDDYNWTVDGELVFVPFIDCSDERCGCTRGFAGMTSHRATTTARIVDRPGLDDEEYFEVLIDGMESQGYVIRGDDLLEDAVDEVVSAVQALGSVLGPGTVVGRSGMSLMVRSPGTHRVERY